MENFEFDVLVIGAGMAGISVAGHLAQSCRVAVLEREAQPGYHATGRSAALFSSTYGGTSVRALSRASRAFFDAPPSGFAEAPLLKQRGSLYVGTEDQLPKLAALAALTDTAADAHRLSAEAAMALCPILRRGYVAGAVFEPGSADVDVHGLMQGYLRMLRSRDGALVTERPVDALEYSGSRWIARSGDERFAAPVVVNAAGAWADQIACLAGVVPIGLRTLRRTALLVDAPQDRAIDAWPMVIDAEEQFYFKPDAGLLLLSPADESLVEPCDAQPFEWDVAVAIDRVQSATTLEVKRVKHRWAGLRSFVADRGPVAGFDAQATGFFWLAGQGGYGIQTAPALSRAAAALVLGQPLPADLLIQGVDMNALSPLRLRGGSAMQQIAAGRP